MMSISIAIVVALTLSAANTEKLEAPEIEQLSTIITNFENPTLAYTEALVEPVIQNANSKKIEVVKNPNIENTNLIKPISTKKVPVQIVQPIESSKTQTLEHVDKQITSSPQKTRPKATLIPQPVLGIQSLEIPALKDWQLKKLRKILYKNLSEDNLIQFQGQFVSIELPGQKIILNEVELPIKFYNKYAELTTIAGTGPDRRIEFNPKYVRVGDIKNGKFRGHGVGTYLEEFPSTAEIIKAVDKAHEKVQDKEELISTERKALYKFANKVMERSDITPKGKSFFPVNVKSEKLTMLHQELYEQLLLDNLIEAKTDYVYIQIPRHDIAINGKKLQIPLPTKYMNIVDAYKIKYGPRRAILLSENTISVGDYIEGDFTGTSVILID